MEFSSYIVAAITTDVYKLEAYASERGFNPEFHFVNKVKNNFTFYTNSCILYYVSLYICKIGFCFIYEMKAFFFIKKKTEN